MQYIVQGRNKENSLFSVKPLKRNSWDKLIAWLNDEPNYSIKSELLIMFQIRQGSKFFVKNGDKLTKVVIFGDHIRTEANNTTEDNLGNLPLIKQ